MKNGIFQSKMFVLINFQNFTYFAQNDSYFAANSAKLNVNLIQFCNFNFSFVYVGFIDFVVGNTR